MTSGLFFNLERLEHDIDDLGVVQSGRVNLGHLVDDLAPFGKRNVVFNFEQD